MAKFENVNGRRYYEEVEKDWLREHYPLLPPKETTRLFNEKFNHNKGVKTLRKYCNNRLGLHCSEDVMSRKYDGMRKEVGHIFTNCRGEVLIKTEDGYKKLTHTLVDVPKGYVAIHLDGDSTNNSIENIAVVKNGIQTTARNLGMTSSDPDITLAGIKCAELYKLLGKEYTKQYEN